MMQYLPQTWSKWSTDTLGYVAEQTMTNEMYVAVLKIDSWLSQGHSEYEVAQIWNSGKVGDISGINKHGVAFDTRKYALAVISQIR